MQDTSQISDPQATAQVHADPHDSSNNKPLKEIGTALIGIVLLLAIILLIAISAWLRPAGEHVALETVDATAEEVVATQSSIATEGTATTQPDETPAGNDTAVAEDTQAPADGTVDAQ